MYKRLLYRKTTAIKAFKYQTLSHLTHEVRLKITIFYMHVPELNVA